MPVPMPSNERERVRALRALEILDTAPEDVYDDLALLAAEICECPRAFVNFVDADRTWTKAAIGQSRVEARREDAICSQTIYNRQTLVVSDACFYAGAPLITAEGYALGTLCVLDNVPRELAPEQLRALETLARQVVGQLELRRTLRQLGEVDRLKEQFVGTISHELRTPVTSIIAYLEPLAERESGPLTEEQERFLEVIERNVRRLSHLVDDLLVAGQVEGGEFELTLDEVDLVEVARESVEAASSRADERGIRLTFDAEPVGHVHGDRDRLAQLVDNLVSNAIKFTPTDGNVDVRVRRRGACAVVEVEDDGVGVPADEQEHLFERFYRASNATDAWVQGTGLGLTISKAIAEAHGGSIDFESREGVGTTFRVEVPATVSEVRA